MKTLNLTIEGMSCGHCLNAVNRSLATLPGVAVKSVAIGRATVSYDPAAIGAREISAAVEGAGYRVAGSSE
jgi:copper chaperone CopZ